MKGRDSHARFRELIAARLDGPLTRSELRGLSTHLKSCVQCRQVDREYREHRQRLRSLPSPLPPRDLWARTSGALDREVARGSYRRSGYGRIFGARRRSPAPSAAILTGIAALGLVGALAVLQLGPSFERPRTTEAGMPTPFAVSPQSLAFVGSGAADVSVYRTQVNQVCPPAAPDCVVDEDFERSRVSLPGNARPRNAALSPSGDQLALVGRYVGEDVIAVVTLPRQQSSNSAGQPTEMPSSPDRPNGNDGPPVDPTQPPATDGTASGPSDSVEPTQSPDASGQPAESPSGIEPTPPPPNEPSATDDGNLPGNAEPELAVVAILEDVQITGAPPAWSANSETLAFSAMPADGRHGPDVYVWSAGDAHARPVTDDHRSLFASWSGRRIVVSRLADAGKSAPNVKTVVIDPASLEERTVALPAVWLPTVNPGRTHVVVWYGELGRSNGLPAPRAGALYLVDWAAVDPFAEGAPTPTPEPSPEPSPESTDQAGSTDGASSRSAARKSDDVVLSPAPDRQRLADATSDPTDFNDANEIPDGFVAIDPDRDPRADPVIDWQAHWSVDGQVLGIWIADVPGSTWGRLVVQAVDRRERLGLHRDAVVAPTLAQRGFTLGHNRVAWVAPSDDDRDGELRIRTWGSDGDGGLRLGRLDVQEVVPAF